MYEMINFSLLPLTNHEFFWIELGVESLKITLQLIKSFFGFGALSNYDQKLEYVLSNGNIAF